MGLSFRGSMRHRRRVMGREHMKKVAERNRDKSEREFRRYLARAGWNNTEIEYMWGIANKWPAKEEERGID